MPDVSIFDSRINDPCPAQFNLAGYVLAQASAQPDKVALQIVGSQPTMCWTYRQLNNAVLGTAGALVSMGLPKGARILLRIGNTVDFPILFLASVAAGYVPVPTSTMLTKPEVRGIVQDIDPALVVFGDGIEIINDLACATLSASALKPLRDHDPTDFQMGAADRPAYIVFTSGTSGHPRAVEHAHRAIWARRMMWDGWYGLRRDDRMLHAGAFNWTYTLGTGLMDPWAIGATAIVIDGPADRHQLPGLIQQAEATLFAATPGILRQMLGTENPLYFPRLRHALSAGEKLPQSVRAHWRQRTGTHVYEAMGMSEISTFLSSSPTNQADDGALGLPQTGRHVAVLAPETLRPVSHGTAGILAVHKGDPGLMLGYVNAPQETAEKFAGDWFLTGDMVSMAPNGSVTYLGRNDDMMNAGGYRVSPLEVEAVLNAHPDIIESAATAIEIKPDTFVIAAFYLAKGAIDQKQLNDFCTASLAAYKCPRLFVRLDELPKGANGKLRRGLLKTQVTHDQT